MSKTLYEYLSNGFGKAEDLNCAEKILHGANEVYKLGISKDDLKLAAGFGGGMGIGSTCGVVPGAIMAFSKAFVKERSHESPLIKKIEKEFIEMFQKSFNDLDCKTLVKNYRTKEAGCDKIIFEAAKIFDEIMDKYYNK